MHIAICLWGIVRSLRYTINSLKQHCLDPITNGGHTYEIYMHTYRFSGTYTGVRSREIGVQLNFSEWNLISPDHVYVEDQDLFDQHVNYTQYETLGDPWNNNFTSMKNHIRALNSLHHLASWVEKESQYKDIDGVVYLRPDATYLNELPYYLLEHFPRTLFLPDFHRSCQGGEYNDRMAMGDLKSAVTYGKRFEHALDYAQRKPLHSESYTYDYLNERNVSVREIPFRFKRMRANGEHHVRDEIAIVSPRNQKPQQEYTTGMALRLVYTVLEEVTNHKVYIWNHDDHENLYCKPHPYIPLEECMMYRRRSRRMRQERELGLRSAQLFGQRQVSSSSSSGGEVVAKDSGRSGVGEIATFTHASTYVGARKEPESSADEIETNTRPSISSSQGGRPGSKNGQLRGRGLNRPGDRPMRGNNHHQQQQGQGRRNWVHSWFGSEKSADSNSNINDNSNSGESSSAGTDVSSSAGVAAAAAVDPLRGMATRELEESRVRHQQPQKRESAPIEGNSATTAAAAATHNIASEPTAKGRKKRRQRAKRAAH